jgi:hypothetical protein
MVGRPALNRQTLVRYQPRQPLSTSMRTFQQFLREFQFADLHPKPGQWERIPTTVLQHAQHEPAPNIDTELFDLLDKSYAYIGGHVDFQRPSDIPANHTIWYGIDIDGDAHPEGVKFGKPTPFGTKWTGGATDGSPLAKQRYITDTVKLLNTPGNYCEMSDAIMHIMVTRYRVSCVQTQAQVEKILGKPVEWVGAHPSGKYPGYQGFYTRTLGGQPHLKILLGRPN